jgi:hypothetical protein
MSTTGSEEDVIWYDRMADWHLGWTLFILGEGTPLRHLKLVCCAFDEDGAAGIPLCCPKLDRENGCSEFLRLQTLSPSHVQGRGLQEWFYEGMEEI